MVITVEDVRWCAGAYGEYPLVEGTQDDGLGWAFHAFRDVAQSELAAADPQIGDKISISFGGIATGKNYYRYRIRKVGGTPKRIDWSKVGGAAGAPAEPEVAIDTAELPAPASSIAERAEDFGAEPPF